MKNCSSGHLHCFVQGTFAASARKCEADSAFANVLFCSRTYDLS